MLLTVEGGGFFSSSVSGYSKVLTLLLSGRKHEEGPMRVSPWNHYQLVDQESDPDLNQLASIKNRLSRGCTLFACFGRTSGGLDAASGLKVGPVQLQDVLPEPLVLDKTNGHRTQLDDGNSTIRHFTLKSSLKKQPINTPISLGDVKDHEASGEKDGDIPSHAEQRKVHWMDACGSELAEIREFEPSEIVPLCVMSVKEVDQMMNSIVEVKGRVHVRLCSFGHFLSSMMHISEAAFGGGLIRDHRGIWVSGFLVNIGVCSVLQAELWCIHEGVKLALRLSLRNLIVENDNLQAIEALNGTRQMILASSPIVNFIYRLAGDFDEISFQHIDREANASADRLAHLAHDYARGVHVLEDSPPDFNMTHSF